MSELSNLLRQRLIAREEAGQVHPDADTLSAFSEQLLPNAERRHVLAHLAVCAECREVLALSQPELSQPVIQPVFTPVPLPAWRRFFKPAFGLAGAAAAMAVITVLVLQTPQKTNRPQPNQQAQVAPLPDHNAVDQSAAVEAKPASPVQAQALDSFNGQETASASRAKARNERSAPAVAGLLDSTKNSLPAKNATARSSSAAPIQPALTAALKKQDFLNSAFFETDGSGVVMAGQSGNLPSAPAPRSLATETKLTTNSGQITSFYDIPANAGGKSNVRLLTPAPPPDHFGFNLSKIVVAGAHSVFHRTPVAPAIKSNSLVSSAMGSSKFSRDLQKSQSSEMAAAPESAEAGAPQPGALAGHALSPSSFASAGTAPVWKVAGGKLFRSAGQEWEDAYPGASFQFTAVNARGNEVWAGGSQAALIHSRDGGAHWETAKLGDAASGSIVSIVILGNNVQVKTSDDQSWSSSDGGKTWLQSTAATN